MMTQTSKGDGKAIKVDGYALKGDGGTLRGFVKLKKFQKSEKNSEVGG